MRINVYIESDIANPNWVEVHCANCGQQVGEYKGEIFNVVLNSRNPPINVFKVNTSYGRVMCRRCKAKLNIIVHTFSTLV